MRTVTTSDLSRAVLIRTVLICAARTALAVSILVVATGCAAAQKLGIGPAPDPGAIVSSDTAEQAYEKARAYFRAQRWDDAEDAFEAVYESYPDSPYAADARFHEAESRYGGENFRGAFELYKRYLDKHPLSAHASTIQRRVYDIGVYTIQTGKRGRLGIFKFADDGVEMLDFLVGAFPHGDLSDDALMYAAEYEIEAEKHLRAIGHLHDLVEFYPGSEWALAARLQLARSYRGVNRGDAYDAEALRRAAAQYKAYVEIVTADTARAREYASLLDTARSELRGVNEVLARKMLQASEYYLRTGKPDAAAAELRNLVTRYPASDAAAEARRRLAGPEQGAGGGR